MNGAYGSFGVYGVADAAQITIAQLDRAARKGFEGGPITVVTGAPAPMTAGSANLIGAHLRLSYWFGIAARYMDGRGVGAGWGPDASTKAMGWAAWYYQKAQAEMVGRALPATRLYGVGLGSPQDIHSAFAQGAQWLQGYVAQDPAGGLAGIVAILRAIGSIRVTTARQEVVSQSGQGGASRIPGVPDLVPDLTPDNPLDALSKALKTVGIVGGISLGALALGMVYLAARK